MSRLINFKPTGTPPPEGQIEITVRLKPGKGRKEMLDLEMLSQPPSRRKGMSRNDLLNSFKADEADLTTVKKFASDNNLTLVGEDPNKRTIYLSGTIRNMEKAFNTTLNYYEHEDSRDGIKQTFISNDEEIIVPEDLKEVVEGIVGLSNTPYSRSGDIRMERESATSTLDVNYTGDQYAKLYKFPSDLTGKGQKIALIELGGGYLEPDIVNYFSKLAKMPVPNITQHSVLKATNNPGKNIFNDVEVTMDIEVAGSAAPGANIEVYFSENNARGLLEAILAATHDGCQVISISWGKLESKVFDVDKNAISNALREAANLSSTVLCASGDFGSTGKLLATGASTLNVQFPASSPYALACGGTSVTVENNEIKNEVVWNAFWVPGNEQRASGGGFSNGFGPSFPNLRPPYQTNVLPTRYSNQLKRGIPDISASADLSGIGHKIIFQSKVENGGGTSAVAPLLAGLFARINEKMGDQGFVNGMLYQLTSNHDTYRQVLQGNNNIAKDQSVWDAGDVWNPCTGLGTPNGVKILEGFEALNS